MAKLTAASQVATSPRPVLHHLNGDTSWLLQIPRSETAKPNGRTYFNVLIDPWFTGPQRQFFTWFHDQSHTVPSAVETIAELEAFLATTEEQSPPSEGSLIDAIILTLHVSDHTHPETLRQVNPDVAVYALEQTVSVVKAMKHFKRINSIPFWTSGSDWEARSVPVNPDQISVCGVRQSNDLTQLHHGILLTFPGTSNDESRGASFEAILYAPHGIRARYLEHVAKAYPPLRFTALMQAFHLVKVGVASLQDDVVHGSRSALEVARLLRAECIVSTHDELKEERGATSYMLTREVLHIEDALNEEGKRNLSKQEGLHRVEGVVLDSGEHRLL